MKDTETVVMLLAWHHERTIERYLAHGFRGRDLRSCSFARDALTGEFAQVGLDVGADWNLWADVVATVESR